ncbi:type II toxin-antitoxin system RelE/ParE family toxin [Mesorhizobium sp.]|uniref:type II toxin-antitoxin system RelE/ParE family toxin n=1 Tax=Mesorhizobium sp. TaxID=1871066 RepID=UPI000FE8ACDE|nr:type II toxin-antitoxin system RelE/ParE family toxin [Mesorhizobium sp.]RWM21350.1 MAG: type II toxin-antitoxin system RelE/ParE family toxin [Mesorhizobium sp.]
MEHEVVFHPQAKVELEELYEHISERASPAIAWSFVAGIRDHCRSLSTFPARGTERTEIKPGLRIVGYRRTVSIAFAVENERVLILGIFYGGRNITPELFEERR